MVKGPKEILDAKLAVGEAHLSSKKKSASLEKNISETVVAKTLEKMQEIQTFIERDFSVIHETLVNGDVWEDDESADIEGLFVNAHRRYDSVVVVIEKQSEMISNLIQAGRDVNENPTSDFLKHYNSLARKITENKAKLEQLSSSLKLISDTLPDQSSKNNSREHYKSYANKTLADVNDFVSSKVAELTTMAEPKGEDEKANNERINFLYDLYPVDDFNKLVPDFTGMEEDLIQYKKDLADKELSSSDLLMQDNARDLEISTGLAGMFVLKSFFDAQPEMVSKLKKSLAKVGELTEKIKKLNTNQSVETKASSMEKYETLEHVREVMKDRILSDTDYFDALAYLDDKVEALEERLLGRKQGVSGKMEVKDTSLAITENILEQAGVFSDLKDKMNLLHSQYGKDLAVIKSEMAAQVNIAVQNNVGIEMNEYTAIGNAFLDRYKGRLDDIADKKEVKTDVKKALDLTRKSLEKQSIPESPVNMFWAENEKSGDDLKKLSNFYFDLYNSIGDRILDKHPEMKGNIDNWADIVNGNIEDYIMKNQGPVKHEAMVDWIENYLDESLLKLQDFEKAFDIEQKKDREEISAGLKELRNIEEARQEQKNIPPSPFEVFLSNSKEVKELMDKNFKIYDSIQDKIIKMHPGMEGNIDNLSDIVRGNIEDYIMDNNYYNDFDNKKVISWIKKYLESSLKNLRRFEKLQKNEKRKDRAEILADLKETIALGKAKAEEKKMDENIVGKLESLTVDRSLLDELPDLPSMPKTKVKEESPIVSGVIEVDTNDKINIPPSPAEMFLKENKDLQDSMKIQFFLFKSIKTRIVKMNPRLGASIQSDIDKIRNKINSYLNKNLGKKKDKEVVSFIDIYLKKEVSKFREFEKLLEGEIGKPKKKEKKKKGNYKSKEIREFNKRTMVDEGNLRDEIKNFVPADELKEPVGNIDKEIIMSDRFDNLKVEKMLFDIQRIYDKENLGKLKNKFDLLRMSPKELLSYLRKIQKNLKGKDVDDTVKQVKKLKRWAKDALVQG